MNKNIINTHTSTLLPEEMQKRIEAKKSLKERIKKRIKNAKKVPANQKETDKQIEEWLDKEEENLRESMKEYHNQKILEALKAKVDNLLNSDLSDDDILAEVFS